MAQNLDIWDWRLSDEEMARIATLDEDESLFNYGTAAGARARRAFKATTRQPSQPFATLRPFNPSTREDSREHDVPHPITRKTRDGHRHGPHKLHCWSETLAYPWRRRTGNFWLLRGSRVIYARPERV